MKKRTSARTNSEPKTSAAERTVPLTKSIAVCPECKHEGPLSECTRRTNGSPECSECGAIVGVSEKAAATVSNTSSSIAFACPACAKQVNVADAPKRDDGNIDCPHCGKKIVVAKKTDERMRDAAVAPKTFDDDSKKPKAYCNKCGSEWGRVDGRPFPNCGHTDGYVDHPDKAESYNPPAGLQNPTISKRLASLPVAEEKAPKEVVEKEQLSVLSSPAISLSVYPDRVEGGWGKSMFRIGDFATFNVPEFKVTRSITGGRTAAQVGSDIIDEMEALAEESFKRQCRWYFAKLKFIDAEIAKYTKE